MLCCDFTAVFSLVWCETWRSRKVGSCRGTTLCLSCLFLLQRMWTIIMIFMVWIMHWQSSILQDHQYIATLTLLYSSQCNNVNLPSTTFQVTVFSSSAFLLVKSKVFMCQRRERNANIRKTSINLKSLLHKQSKTARQGTEVVYLSLNSLHFIAEGIWVYVYRGGLYSKLPAIGSSTEYLCWCHGSKLGPVPHIPESFHLTLALYVERLFL